MTPDQVHNYLLAQFQKQTAYHNHKEQMAYLIFGFEAAFFAGIFALGNWPPAVDQAPRSALALAIVLSWALFHTLLRYQLRLRRFAAISVAAIIDTLEQSATLTIKDKDIAVPVLGAWREFVDSLIWPVPRSIVVGDVGPAPLRAGTKIQPQTIPALYYHETIRRVDAMGKRKNYAQASEWIVTLGSLLLLAMAMYRVGGDLDRGPVDASSVKLGLVCGVEAPALTSSEAKVGGAVGC